VSDPLDSLAEAHTIHARLCDDTGTIDLAALNRLRTMTRQSPWAGDAFTCTGSFTAVGLTVRCTSPAHHAPLLSAEINALPDRVRYYIHDIETRCDPSGDVQTIASLTEQRDGLLLALADARRAEEFIAREGYRRCDAAECNCGEWHGGHAARRLREVMEECDE
jgi:hypothetical protein